MDWQSWPALKSAIQGVIEMNVPAPVNSLKIETRGLGACLEVNALAVPKYQRAFSWESEDVANFLADINTSFSNGEPEYFMGSIVLQGTHNSYEVVDGQQRLTMATIFIAAVRDRLRQLGMEDVAKSLESRFLFTKETWSQVVSPKLMLSVYDNDFFGKTILGNEAIKSEKESHDRMVVAKRKALEFFESIRANHNDWYERIAKFVNYLASNVRVIEVVVHSDANAYVIFETLNDRGKDLSASDLLKNYLFGRAGERLDEVQARWNQMLGILEVYGGDKLVITYIRQLWSATRELAREKELFSKIKEKIVNPQAAVDLAEELVKRAEHYAAILNPSHPFWLEAGDEAAALIGSISELPLERYRPAMLAILGHFKGKDLTQSMRLILAGSVRFLVAVGAGGGSLEAAYSDAARKIVNGQIKNYKEFGQELSSIIPNDEIFQASFQNARLSKGKLARYFLAALERAARGEANCELVPNSDIQSVNLEHVLPENPGPGWEALSPELVAALSRRIGNLALLSASKNSKIGNAAFSEKRKVLAESEFVLTKEISEKDEWGQKEIEERQKRLAQLALVVWPYAV